MAGTQEEAVVFARVSTVRQEKEGLSLKEIQLPDAEKYATRNNLKIVKVFAISETGGNYKTRAKFNEMIKYVKAHKNVKHIISYRVDRMTRNFADFVLMDDLRLNHDKSLHFIEDRLVITKTSRTSETQQWDFKALIAKQYLDRTKEDGTNIKLRKLENGELPWNPPYGYKHKVISENPKKKTIVSVEPKATIVRQIFIRYATGNFSCFSLAKSINDEFGTHLNKGQIHHILVDKFYIGIMTDRKGGGTQYPHFYEKLVSDDIFEQTQAIMNGHSTQRRRYGGLPSIFRGLIDCEQCGCTITPDPKKKKLADGSIKEYPYYRCSNGKHFHEKMLYVSEKEIEDQIKQVLKRFNIPEQRMAVLRQMLNETHESKINFYDEQRKELVARRNQLSKMQQKSYDLLTSDSITLDIYNENDARYKDELAEIQRKEERLDNADQQFYVDAGYLLSIFEHAEKLFEVAEIDEKKQIIGLILSNLKLDGKKLTFTLKKPFDVLLSQPKGLLWLPGPDSNRQPRS